MCTNEKVGTAPHRGIAHLHVLCALTMMALGMFAAALPEAEIVSANATCTECSAAVPVNYSASGVETAGLETASYYDRYAAIAFCKETGWWGYAYNYSTLSGAEVRALENCVARGGTDCRIKVWVRNGCCALAVGNEHRHGWGWATGSNDYYRARSRALEECRSRTANCRIVCWTCTNR